MKSYSFTSVVRVGTTSALLGTAVGVLIGVLVAPEHGAQLRRRLAFRLDQSADAVGGLVQDWLDKPEPSSDARRSSQAVVADAKAEAQRIRSEIDRLLKEQKARAAS